MTRIDYYELLGVECSAAEGEIKSAYRRLALRHHPDRNGGAREAEERFKAISEAYGVLSDPGKRAAYDAARRGGGQGPFGYSQQDIFADLLRAMAAGGLRDLGPEFARSGLRFDEAFLRGVFFGGAPFVMRGFFFTSFPGGATYRTTTFRTAASPAATRRATLSSRLLAPVGRWLLRQMGKAAVALVGLGLRRLERRITQAAQAQADTLDLTYRLSVTRREAREGTSLDLSCPCGAGVQRVSVRVPPGTTPGATLRLSGLGLARRGQRGDLLLVVDVV